ncbi:MAG: methyltransferase domain-containing protein [Deltaproteobacteria bacterium]|nr:methyltransferase domain-containing protein [Deltaproteobacteria bacterium]MBW2499270.1 methyltransferase domain-containing protein [Deltaproteobacteria bacterium]
MAITIDSDATHAMTPCFDEAMELVLNEFIGLDTERQYRNAFSRLLKPDPLRRVLMMGTDQRDLFVPMLRATIAGSVPLGGHVLDLGAGDGQTFALVADALPAGTTVSFEEPNAHYVADYRAMLAGLPHLRPGMALAAGFDEIDAAAQRSGVNLPDDGSIDLVLALHMIFFLADLRAGLTRMARFLKPGGALFVVVADETDGYTGLVLQAFVAAGGDTGDNALHLAAITERRRLLAGPEEGGRAILGVLREALPGTRFALETVRQPSRLYGHSLADLVVLANISTLSQVDGLFKFETACRLLRETPEVADLRIEDDGPRKGMWSVTQPQFIAVLRRELD